ncbi:intraflagellar transport protein 25 homolog isoform X2 [Leucoraja erinacea]|uniref:intraflagellar transport protein 25 homolog isoform X2 n=1 Tax=Leucoraja erinaceus TaxID=7782 RepID=UPI002456EDC4|nr:intraflagellar transport protein 25 homolog isoform X2 [Leucoraja erinacea]
MKRDFGSAAAAGTELVLATSGDEKHPPENIVDGNTETFWITTGMFPQEFILRFPELIKISCVKIHCYNGKMVIIASFHDGRALPSLRVQLKQDRSRGVSSFLKALYHSGANPSLPGDLLDLSLLIPAP